MVEWLKSYDQKSDFGRGARTFFANISESLPIDSRTIVKSQLQQLLSYRCSNEELGTTRELRGVVLFSVFQVLYVLDWGFLAGAV